MTDTNRVSLIYCPEATLGVTPTNSNAWKTMRFKGEQLRPDYTGQQSEEIRADRNRGDVVTTSARAGGTIDIELSAGSYDDIIEAVLGGTWTGDVLKVGTTKRSFSFEKAFNDLPSGNKFDQYLGQRIGQFMMNLQYGQIATGQITLAGTGVTDSATSAVGTGSVAAATTTPVMNSTVDVIEVMVDGVESALAFKSLQLTLGAQLREKTAIGKLFARDQGYGSALIQLQVQAYFENRSLEDKVRSGAPFELQFTIGDGQYEYDILLPRAYRTQREGLNAPKLDDDVMHSVTLAGAYDSTAGSSVVITRRAV